ncbi:hypothetical protein HYFRA_00002992 [Hymenoscyphus fraxineus]|uniref:Uncharacterized protein n=1 Tax=Hymenoscyphus fraxineus TaxID=746836 RepID=A0A9N9KRM1_9HELO|nr:hypothetical protein HYFRA_00002992 [Hymenoscyphus fraxineus]
MHISPSAFILLFLLQSQLPLGCADNSVEFSQIFHGTSVVVYPNASTSWPGNSTFVAANFYCYFTSSGYVSFGWWLPAVPGGDHSHCKPGSSAYDWYEITTSSNCDNQGCRTHIKNFNASDSSKPAFEEDYRLAALDLGNGQLGRLGLSFFDREGGGYAVGTRRVLSEPDADTPDVEACLEALHTFRLLQKEHGLNLSFELSDICTTDVGVLDHGGKNSGPRNQMQLAAT